MQLPEDFVRETRRIMGDERFGCYLKAFEEEPPVSIRLNPRKVERGAWSVEHGEPVPWCNDGYYLSHRPNFTMDPLLHAGCYYVQEAASMFLWWVIAHAEHNMLNTKLSSALDMCAAPGGKSTLLRSMLPDECLLISNEPIAKRASILEENVTKWGYPNHLVTCQYPRDFVKKKQHFDLILCDVPCSGEGMFRKDPATIGEWSLQQVEKCWQLQRDIVRDAWHCLNDGGILIYSTCTFNIKENEENIRWMTEELGAEVLPVTTKPEWHITGSLLEGFNAPVYRFIPGITRGEGLFMAILRKGDGSHSNKSSLSNYNNHCNDSSPITPTAPLTYQEAISYLRREALHLSDDIPRGVVTVSFQGFPLGQVKNIGSRANNLYPKEWRIKTTHTPTEYEPILRKK